MKRTTMVSMLAFALMVVAQPADADCVKIKDGTLQAANGAPLKLGYDEWGYNYQAHLFNGLYGNYTRPVPPLTEGAENLVMKWSDDWLANVDCDGDGKLDRGLDSKTGVITGVSRGWTTNHFEGDYLGSDGEMHHYTYFVKIVWVGPPPAGTDPWAEVRLWGQYAIVEELQNDPFGEGGGKIRREKLVAPGLGLDYGS